MAFAYKHDNHMPCYSPLRGYFGKDVNPKTGRRPIVFSLSGAFSGVPVMVPCGKCIGCRLERSRQWALRIVHEKRMHSESAFLTLTYADEHLPAGNSLVLRDLQLFMKRLRDKRWRERKLKGLRFYGCGEYGDTYNRPHYHVLLLNTGFSDMRRWKSSGSGKDLYVSKELESLWSIGHSYIGDVTFESAAYVARYCTKKINGDPAEAHYNGRLPEFSVMSRKPGIGMSWFESYHGEAYAHDSAISGGVEVPLTRFYDSKFERIDNKAFERIKRKRRRKALARKEDNTPARRRVRERLAELTAARFARDET